MDRVQSNISKAMNDTVIRRLAGAQPYQRGLDYFSHGHVESLAETTEGVRAMVRGSQNYTVMLMSDEGVIDYSCDCPIGSEGAFCKHCVAAALACLNGGGAALPKPPARRKAKELTLADAGKILQNEDKEALVSMLLDWAKDDDRLRERLILFAARRSGPDTGVATVRRAFETAVRVRGFMHYREASGWARGVDDAIDSIEQLLNDGHAAAVIELCEAALESLLRAIESVDDSDGHFSMLSGRLQDIHYRACSEARPDPVDLGRRLFQYELTSDFDVFHGAAERYAQILGSKGLSAYRQLAEAAWAEVPARTAEDERAGWGYFRITHIMESLARASGDIEELVAVMSRDLSSAYDYLQIAEVYRQAGRHDEALRWAEKGLKAFPDGTDPRLREFAAEEYHRRKRSADAMNLMWAEFSERPFLETYKTLAKHAKKAGAWPEWRERALAEIRAGIAQAKEMARGQTRPHWMAAGDDHSLLVEIFLYEGRAEDAWSEAVGGGCSGSLWLRLASKREKGHPEDAAPIYWKYAEAGIAGTTNGRYEDAVELLAKAAAVMKRLERSAEFVRNLEALRAKYKIKRNFIKLVEQKRESLYLV